MSSASNLMAIRAAVADGLRTGTESPGVTPADLALVNSLRDELA